MVGSKKEKVAKAATPGKNNTVVLKLYYEEKKQCYRGKSDLGSFPITVLKKVHNLKDYERLELSTIYN